MWSATKTRQYHPESRTRMPFRRGAIRGHSTVASNQSRPPDTQQRRLRQRHMRRAATARDSTNQSSPPGMQRAVQKGRRFVSERSVELSKNASASSGDTDTSDNFRSGNPGVFNSGATYRLELQCYHLAGKSERKKKQQQPQQQQQGIINVVQCKGGHPFVDPTENVGGPDSATCIYEG